MGHLRKHLETLGRRIVFRLCRQVVEGRVAGVDGPHERGQGHGHAVGRGGSAQLRLEGRLVGGDRFEILRHLVRVRPHLRSHDVGDQRLETLRAPVPVQLGIEGDAVERRRLTLVEAPVELLGERLPVGPALLGNVTGLAGHVLALREALVEEELFTELDLARGDRVVGRDGDLHVMQALGRRECRRRPRQGGDAGGGIRRRRQPPVDQAGVALVEGADVGEHLPHVLVGDARKGPGHGLLGDLSLDQLVEDRVVAPEDPCVVEDRLAHAAPAHQAVAAWTAVGLKEPSSFLDPLGIARKGIQQLRLVFRIPGPHGHEADE